MIAFEVEVIITILLIIIIIIVSDSSIAKIQIMKEKVSFEKLDVSMI